MKTNFIDLGTLLSREEARKILGGNSNMRCQIDADCPVDLLCMGGYCAPITGVYWTGSQCLCDYGFSPNDIYQIPCHSYNCAKAFPEIPIPW